MATAIDRDELQRLLRDQDAQLVEVLPRAEFEDEHLPAAASNLLVASRLHAKEEVCRALFTMDHAAGRAA